jgi:ATP-dependent Lhr-like helicase
MVSEQREMEGGEPFARLHSALRYHVVNTLGWSRLRPLQEAAIGPVLAGHDVLLTGPTAGGKTEAVALPLLTRMDAECWRSLSVLYVCPLRALLNNLEPRLAAMAGWLGRRVALWHGDVPDSVRQRIAADPPDILLTTPESLEAMLMSARVDHQWLFANLRAVVVDELHAFAGDDRGWHLLGVLARLTRLAASASASTKPERRLQRVGLTATVGNPEALLDWLADGSQSPRTVVSVPATGEASAKVGLDYVGSLRGAATVIARLHQGTKRLVFCDSRTQAEQLAAMLRGFGVQTFVSHSSLSRETRRQTEAAFASASGCVIVATSTLELGVDIGDLDHVFQIDAPLSVASFLQRLGRTGRRTGSVRNALLLATRPTALWTAVALLLLWGNGYVEAVVPPVLPRHIVAQQLLGLSLQEGHRPLLRTEMLGWLGGLAAVPGASDVLDHLITQGYLACDGGLVWIGPRAEDEFGRRFFLELTSAFTSDPMLTVICGRDVLGELPAIALAVRPGPGERLQGRVPGLPVVLLGGRSWRVTHVDWRRQRVRVEPSERQGRSRWTSGGRAMSFKLAHAHHDVLAGRLPDVEFSRRARSALSELRGEHSFVMPGESFHTYLVREAEDLSWWTFAGFAVNSALADVLANLVDPEAPVGDLALRMRREVDPRQLHAALDRERERLSTAAPAVDDRAIENLKFSAAVPPKLARETVSERLVDRDGVLRTIDALTRLTTNETRA